MIWKMGIIGKIAENGYTKTSFAEALGISRATLVKKLNNSVDFTASEIQKVSILLDIKDKDKYFFL